MKRALPALLSLTVLACAARAPVPPPATSAATAPEASTHPLAATTWRVVSYFDGQRAMASPLVGAPMTLSFDPQGRISGNAGCNSYSAAYRLDNSHLVLGAMAATRRLCPTPPGVMEQEMRYFAALQSAVTLLGDRDGIQLRTAKDSLAVYLRRDDSPAP